MNLKSNINLVGQPKVNYYKNKYNKNVYSINNLNILYFNI